MKAHLKLNGVVQLTNNSGNVNAFESELLQNKYIKKGWRTAQQLLELGLLQEGRPTREVIDIPGQGDIPAVTHTEYHVEANYTIEVEDTTAQEQAEAAAKTERLADLAEIKGFIQDINNSDLKPWHKKILRFLVKEAKE